MGVRPLKFEIEFEENEMSKRYIAMHVGDTRVAEREHWIGVGVFDDMDYFAECVRVNLGFRRFDVYADGEYITKYDFTYGGGPRYCDNRMALTEWPK
jgi:hypothetical protein